MGLFIDIFLCCIPFLFVLLPSFIAWLVPQSKKSKSDTVLAFRWLPPIFAIFAFLSACVFVYSPLNYLIPAHLISGILLMVLGLVIYCRIVKHNTPHFPMAKKALSIAGHYFSILFLSTIIFIFVGLCSFVAALAMTDPYNPDAKWQEIKIPSEPAFYFEQKAAHIFLAEYYYRIKFESGKTFDLHLNTGGRTDFDVYALKDKTIFIHDKDKAYMIDPSKEEVYTDRVMDGSETYFGKIRYEFISADEITE